MQGAQSSKLPLFSRKTNHSPRPICIVSYLNNSKPQNRAFVNDAQGHAIYVNQGAESGGNSSNSNISLPAVNGRIQNLAGGYLGGWIGNRTTNPGHVQHQMVVAGEVLARYGDAADKSAPAGADPAFAAVAELYLSAPANVLHGGNADPVAHTVVGGETLQSIARATLGDSRLWYRIAQANGLSVQPDAPLQAGVTLAIPKATLSANSASTFKPYDPSSVIGDANPALNALPQPQADDGGCGGFGEVLKLVVIVVVAIYAPEFLPEFITELGGPAVLAASAAVGDVAGQAFANVIGIQHGFDWKEVALAALSAGVGEGLGASGLLPNTGSSLGNVILQRAVGNALTQGVAVVTGLQDQFNWKAVAAAGITAGVGEVVGNALGNTFGDSGAGRFATNFASAAVGSLVANAAVGGHVSGQRVLLDGFGNALRGGAGGAGENAGTQEDRLAQLYSADGDIGRSEVRFNPNAPNYNFVSTDGFDSGFAGRFGTALPRDSSNDVMVADARDKLRLNVLSDADENFYSNIIGRHQASEAQRQDARAQANQALGQRLDRASPIRSGSYGGEMPYDVGYVGDTSATNDAYTGMGLQLRSQMGLNLQSISQGLNPGAGVFDNFSRGFANSGNDFSVLEGEKPFSYSLGSAARTGLGLVYDGLTGAGDFSASGQAFQRGEYVSAGMYGARGLGTVGLTAMTLGDYALAKVGVAGAAGSSGAQGVREAIANSAATRSEAAASILEARNLLRDAGVPLQARNDVIRSFELETFRVQRLSLETTAFRLFDDSNALLRGRYVSNDFFASQTDRIQNFALMKNSATRLGEVTMPERSVVFTGRVAPQPNFGPGLTGGANQIFLTGPLSNYNFREVLLPR
jgi:hypothetical protein